MRRSILQLSSVVFLGLLFGALSQLAAQSKTERMLLERLERLEASNASANRERAAILKSMAKMTQTAGASERASATRSTTAANTAADATEQLAQVAEDTAEIKVQAAEDADASRKEIAALKEATDRRNRDFIIAVIVAVGGLVLKDLGDRRDRKNGLKAQTAVISGHQDEVKKEVLKAVDTGTAKSTEAIEHGNNLTQKVLDMREQQAETNEAMAAALGNKEPKKHRAKRASEMVSGAGSTSG